MNNQALPNHIIACIDMRSFYASVSAVDAGLNAMEDAICVVGDLERKGSVVLAASPRMKKEFGIKTGARLFEIPNHPDIHLIEPKMELFVRVSMEISRLFEEYVRKEDIFVYSIDESFLKLHHTDTPANREDALRIIHRIQDDLIRLFHLPSAVGVGPNMLLAKLALDLEGKKKGIAWWDYKDVPEKLWPVAPLSEMWGIGSRTERNLNNMGIFSVGDLANYDLTMLEERFGVMGNQLHNHANGIDLSGFGGPGKEEQVSYGKGQVLFRDYDTASDVMAVVLEMCEDVARRAREAGRVARTIHLGVGYSKTAFGGGFSRSRSIDEPTNETMSIYRVCQELFYENYTNKPVRNLNVSITNLEDESSMQLSLFDTQRWEKRRLGAAMDSIRSKYGSTSILRAVSYTDAGTAVQRATLLGGHKK